MKANELRIGNFYNQFGNVTEVTWSCIKDLLVASDSQLWCKPIPLTEEWLLRFGFAIDKSYSDPSIFTMTVLYTHFYLSPAFDGGYYWGFTNDEGDNSEFYDGRAIQYVHELQNLYHAITGEELAITEPAHNPCQSDDPDDQCENCNCWKSTRANCS